MDDAGNGTWKGKDSLNGLITSAARIGTSLLVHKGTGNNFIAYEQGNQTWVGKNTDDDANANPPGETPPPTPGDPTNKVTAGMVQAAVETHWTLSHMLWPPDQIAAAFNQAIGGLEPGSFTTKAQLAALVGECCQETDGFHTMSEYDHNVSYAPYWGRGMIQLTHDYNYQAFGNYAVKRGLTTDPNTYLTNPDQISNDRNLSADAAIYFFTQNYWNGHNLCWYCDDCNGAQTGEWITVSRAINMGSPFATGTPYGNSIRNDAINAALAVTPDPTSSASDAQKVVDYGLSVIDRFAYTQDAWSRSHMLESNAGDCSSFVVLCFTQALGWTNEQLGGSGAYPGYTGTLAHQGTLVNNSGVPTDGPMKLADIVLFDYSGNNPTFDHVALYIGNDKVLSHGGGASGTRKGPEIESLAGYRSFTARLMTRRILP